MTDLSVISAARPLLLVGCGKMGSALLEGWLAQGVSPDAVYIKVRSAEKVRAQFPQLPAENVTSDMAVLADLSPSFILLAVKPQMMDAVLPDYKAFAARGSVFLSVAAGKTLSYFSRLLGDDAAVVRAMPNTPAAIGLGITGLCANAHVAAEQRAVCGALLEAVGDVEWVEDEALIDAITAVSGSGPAYIFYMAEAMTAAGVAAGLSTDTATRLARKTIYGAAALMEQSGIEAGTLRTNVTSPGGTTEAALNVLMADDGLGLLMQRAINAAVKRSKELSD